MDVSQPVVDAYKRRYTQTQLETALDQALADFASGVTMTSVSFDGGSGTGQLSGKPEFVIAHLEEALKQLADSDRGETAITHPVNFHRRRSTT